MRVSGHEDEVTMKVAMGSVLALVVLLCTDRVSEEGSCWSQLVAVVTAL
jgi:hypothetical protein